MSSDLPLGMPLRQPSPRVVTAIAAAVFAVLVSIDPRVAAPSARGPRIHPEPPSSAAIAAAPIQPIDAPPPADLVVDVSSDPEGHRVIVRRKGHLVALRHDGARSAGRDSAALYIGRAARGKSSKARAVIEDQLVWETTRDGGLATDRGVVALTLSGDDLRARAMPAAPPEPAAGYRDADATCASHRDGAGGFTVICRFAKGARRVGVANVTGALALADAWVFPGASPVVRLDLPLSPGAAEGRVIGFVHGGTGAVLRAEAIWVDGEEPTLLLQRSERRQPSVFEL